MGQEKDWKGKIQAAVVGVAKRDMYPDAQLSDTFHECDIDSWDRVCLAMEVEKDLGIVIPDGVVDLWHGDVTLEEASESIFNLNSDPSA